MGKLFYGTQSGMTTQVLPHIQAALGEWLDKVVDIDHATITDFQREEFLVLGGGTFGGGDLTSDWQRFWPRMDEIDFTGKKVALFCLGDAWAYGDTFCSVMRHFYDKVRERGGEIIGHGATVDHYNFQHSDSVVNGVFIGAALDEMNESDETSHRIHAWAQSVTQSLSLSQATATL